MVPRTSYPPITHHPSLTRPLTPSQTQSALSSFLDLATKHAYLHPDAQLSTSGIAFAAQSGPQGGLALHHLRRIEAGLRGERLGVESAEALEAEFGGEVKGMLPEGDDSKLDAAIADGMGVRKGGLKRKRTSEWAETWSQPDVMLPPDAPLQEDAATAGAEQEGEGWEEKDSYEHAQRNEVGDVGDRGAHVVAQNGAPPAVKHAKTASAHDEKRAKREAKKQKHKIDKAERADRKAKG